MPRIRYEDKNLFSGTTGNSDGQIVGPSEIVFGAGEGVMLTLDNPGGAFVIMQRRRISTGHYVNTSWTQVGGGTTTSRQRFNLLVQGHEYRAFITRAPIDEASPVVFSVQNLVGGFTNADMAEVLASFEGNNSAGFSAAGNGDLISTGPYSGLLTNTSLLYLCRDLDPVLQAKFGGLWELSGIDMRKLGLYDSGVLLSDILGGGDGDGDGDGGDGTATTDTFTVIDGALVGGGGGGGGGGGTATTDTFTSIDGALVGGGGDGGGGGGGGGTATTDTFTSIDGALVLAA